MGLDGSDLINSLKEAMATVFDYVGDRKGCFYECSNGAEPVAKRNHIPKSNGCGSFGIQLDTTHVPGIGKCCDKHDICYDTCNHQKEDCDKEFQACLMKICNAMKTHVSKDVYNGCKSTADIMYVGTMALGCKPYRDSQKDACTCSRRRKNEL
ncbi:hypothetical protein V1264_011207 [Littorina saxatilis]|uniref:Uncharacterized protein n=2 Tax=Littorina saxatilis TaxID=31220 RepID=A0AAN9GKS2_9CAEN